ncbi:MAG: DNA recombination protein RmuC [Pseudomonadota bacterium]
MDLLSLVLLAGLVLITVLVLVHALGMRRDLARLPTELETTLENRHRQMLTDLHDGLAKQGDRLASAQADAAERLQRMVSSELSQTRQAIQDLAQSQSTSLAASRESLIQQLAALTQTLSQKQDALKADMLAQTLTKIAEQGRADQELIQTTLRNITAQINSTVEALNKTVEARLTDIGGKVSERLDEGFKRTNETFANVMARLASIDEAQKKIDGLTTNVVSLQQLLGDKRSRGAYGEVQLEALVANIMPPGAYAMQYELSNKTRVDCILFLPDPTGKVCVDSKFPLENYHRMLDAVLVESERVIAQRQFKADVKKHVDDISSKYIIADETSDGAVMFIPAEAVFAEIHAYHSDVVDYAMQRRVWIVSPTTLMAVLNTARAVMKDVETRKQVHIIQDELTKLGKEFSRFDIRMKKLADHIRQAHEDAQDVRITSDKINRRFAQIEQVELEQVPAAVPVAHLRVIDGDQDL